jgi:nicotinamide riboside kinase
MAKLNKSTITKHDIVRSIKELENRINFVANHMRMLDDVLDKYIRMNKHQDKLTKFIEKEVKANEHKQEKRKQSGRSSTPSE